MAEIIAISVTAAAIPFIMILSVLICVIRFKRYNAFTNVLRVNKTLRAIAGASAFLSYAIMIISATISHVAEKPHGATYVSLAIFGVFAFAFSFAFADGLIERTVLTDDGVISINIFRAKFVPFSQIAYYRNMNRRGEITFRNAVYCAYSSKNKMLFSLETDVKLLPKFISAMQEHNIPTESQFFSEK